MKSRAWRGSMGGGIALLLLASGFYLVFPSTPPESARLYLLKAWEVRTSGLTVAGGPTAPSSTTWIGIPLDLVLRVVGSGGATPEEFFVRNGGKATPALRAVWSLLAAGVLLLSRRLVRRILSVEGPALRTSVLLADATLVLFLLLTPVLPLSVRDLLPGLPAALLVVLGADLLLRSSRRRGAAYVRIGLIGGMILAWFPFLWPVVLLLAVALRVQGEPWMRALSALGLAVLLGVVLEPSHLTALGQAPARLAAQWRREGGWGPAAGGSLFAFLSLALLLGPVAWICWIGAALFAPMKGRRGLLLLLMGIWVLLVLVPALSGTRRPGAAQWAVAPILAVWSAWSLGSWPTRSGKGRTAGVLAALLLLATVAPARIGMERRIRHSAEHAQEAWRFLMEHGSPGDLWLSDQALAPASMDSASAVLIERGFVLPRDPRRPSRYDFAYWPRWYAGFRSVLVSAGRVQENLARPPGDPPHAFYHALQTQGRLEKEWGAGKEGGGIRLYQLADSSAWRRPLTEEDLRQVQGGPDLTWFISQLGSLYIEQGDLRTAALLFRRGTEWDPYAAGLFNNLGAVYLRQNEFEEAARAFDRGLQRNPNSFELLFNYGQACARTRLFERAEILLRKAAAVRADVPDVHFELGRAFAAQGKDALARAAFHRYLEMEPRSPRRPQIEDLLRHLQGDGATESPVPARGAAR